MRWVISVLSGVALCGCAAIFNQNSEEVRITSAPEGARVYVNDNPIGRTPMAASLKASESHKIKFAKKGFEETTVLLNYHVGAGWVILDILTALIPIIIDAVTESWYELDSNDIHVVLNAAR